jgi:Fe-S-cluster containining protein
VRGDDWARLGERADALAHFIGNRAFMRMRDGHCAALAVRREAAGVDFFCTIYEQRPEICRALARGSPECAADLAEKAEAVAVAVAGV